MGKEVKTNAMRILDRNKIPYEIINYECDEFIDGLHTAEKTGAPVEQSFKTLVMSGKAAAGGNRQYYVFVVPIAEEVDLKAAAKCVGEKSLEMLHVKDLTPLTGYVRGGYELLKPLNIDPHIKKAALLHHERCDGSGYPLKATQKDLDDFSMVVAIADVYDAMTAARSYRAPLCPFQVIERFEQEGLQKYKPKFILTFLQPVLVYPLSM